MYRIRQLLTLIIVVILVVANIPLTAFATTSETEFAGGSGTVEDPYLISTKAHLDNVRNYPASYFMMINDINFADADFERGGDYYNGGRRWLPINEFRGTFNGNGKSISGLKGPGIFGNVYNAIIENLHMDDHSVGPILFASDIYKWEDGYCAGGIACAISKSKISNCSGSGITIDVSKDGPIGGLVGVSYSSTIENCNFEANNNNVTTQDNTIGLICSFAESTIIGDCKSNGTFTKRGEGELGGIVGTARTCFIYNCENRATLSNTNVWNNSCGGIVGHFTYGGSLADSGIKNCKNLGAIHCTGIDADAGGIVGTLYDGLDQLTLCTNDGNVNGGETAGGIVGLCNSSSTAKIDNCTNNGMICGDNAGGITGRLVEGSLESMHNVGKIQGSSQCGGIAGKSYGLIQKCSNWGKVEPNSGSVYAGGITGTNGNIVSECYNIGTIEANYRNAIIGGIVGLNSSGCEIQDSYNAGDIICDYSNSSNVYTVGGICGQNNQSMQAITNCYNIGNVPEIDDDIGLICGNNQEPGEAFVNCYIVDGSSVADVGFGYGVAGTI